MTRAVIVLLGIAAVFAGCATPYKDSGLPGRVSEKPLSAERYLIQAYMGAYSPPGALKPLVVKRAREVGSKRGFQSFALENVELYYDGRGNGYGADAIVRYGSQSGGAGDGIAYAVNAPDTYRGTADAVDASRLAKLQGSRDARVGGLTITPVFFDAVAASGYANDSMGFLEPGAHRVWVNYWLVVGLLERNINFTQVEARLEAGKSYVARGRYGDTSIELWIEDETTKKPVGPVRTVPRKAR